MSDRTRVGLPLNSSYSSVMSRGLCDSARKPEDSSASMLEWRKGMSGVASGCLDPDRKGIVANEKENVKGKVLWVFARRTTRRRKGMLDTSAGDWSWRNTLLCLGVNRRCHAGILPKGLHTRKRLILRPIAGDTRM
jgi:hypothetical protein